MKNNFEYMGIGGEGENPKIEGHEDEYDSVLDDTEANAMTFPEGFANENIDQMIEVGPNQEVQYEVGGRKYSLEELSSLASILGDLDQMMEHQMLDQKLEVAKEVFVDQVANIMALQANDEIEGREEFLAEQGNDGLQHGEGEEAQRPLHKIFSDRLRGSKLAKYLYAAATAVGIGAATANDAHAQNIGSIVSQVFDRGVAVANKERAVDAVRVEQHRNISRMQQIDAEIAMLQGGTEFQGSARAAIAGNEQMSRDAIARADYEAKIIALNAQRDVEKARFESDPNPTQLKEAQYRQKLAQLQATEVRIQADYNAKALRSQSSQIGTQIQGQNFEQGQARRINALIAERQRLETRNMQLDGIANQRAFEEWGIVVRPFHR